MNSEDFINLLSLKPHPEGGFYKENYRSSEEIGFDELQVFKGKRAISTAIYYLLQNEDISRFHKIKSDEIWHFYTGTAVRIHIIDGQGIYSHVLVGNNLEKGQHFQVVIPAGNWFAAELEQKSSFALCGCTVAPGFHFADFEMATKQQLLDLCPEQNALIERFTR